MMVHVMSRDALPVVPPRTAIYFGRPASELRPCLDS
jgi:hypothetical protein